MYGVYKDHYTPIINKKISPFTLEFSFGVLHKLLFQYSEKNPPIEEQLYLFMKRFRTQPSEFYAMNKGVRERLFNREWRLVQKEAKEAERNAGKTSEIDDKFNS